MKNIDLSNAADTPTSNSASKPITAKGPLIAGLLAGLTASACCAGPLILLMLGISGSWIGNLSAIEPIRPLFILLAIVFLGLAYRKIFMQAKSCNTGAACATTQGKQSQKFLFWLTSLIVLLSISFPWYGPYLFD